jgi:hypothetical protein
MQLVAMQCPPSSCYFLPLVPKSSPFVYLIKVGLVVTRALPIMYRYGWGLRVWQRSASRWRSFKTYSIWEEPNCTVLYHRPSQSSLFVYSRVFRLHATHRCRRSCRSSMARCHPICCRTAEGCCVSLLLRVSLAVSVQTKRRNFSPTVSVFCVLGCTEAYKADLFWIRRIFRARESIASCREPRLQLWDQTGCPDFSCS